MPYFLTVLIHLFFFKNCKFYKAQSGFVDSHIIRWFVLIYSFY
jgi:hypothetical protein